MEARAVVIEIVGDGVAGSMLAASLNEDGTMFRQHGDARANTPPVAFVHLFQGRTFQRDGVEVEAFQTAVDFWSGHPLSHRWEVSRAVKRGDRLHRSVSTCQVPPEFQPREVAPLIYRYGPGFTVFAQELVERTRGSHFHPGRADLSALDGVIVHATGLEIAKVLPDLRWDLNPGRTVDAACSVQPEFLFLQDGCHVGGNPDGEGIAIGGRVSSQGEVKGDETELASAILGAPVSERSVWWGERIANALDRRPMIGWYDDRNFLFAGFGGRALFWLPYCCEVARRALRSGDNEAIPPGLRADRFHGTKYSRAAFTRRKS